MKKRRKALASIAIAGMLSMIPFNALAENALPTRLGGNAAAQTAVEIADQTGWSGTAILASSTSYGMVDALTAGPLAAFLKAPILLQEAGNVLNPDTQAELTKLKVKTVYVTSGTAVISQAVLDQLSNMGIKVVSLGGADRFETSVNIAKKMVELGAPIHKVAVAFGWLNQDALSIASIAAAQTEPILLTEKDAIPASVKAFLAANPSVTATDVIGGTGVISDALMAQFPSATRFAGYTAYDTNLSVLKAFDSVLKYDHVFIANGETAIDALAGAPLAAEYKAGIVLTNGTANEATAYVSTKMTSASVATALGGTAVVPETVRSGVGSTTPPNNEGNNPGNNNNSGGSSGGSSGGGSSGGGSSTSDTTAPLITLNGASQIELQNGDTYTELGVSVSDNKDTGLTPTITYTKGGSSVSSIDTSIAGTYVVHYNAKDAAGNAAAEKTRTVKIYSTLATTEDELNDELANPVITHIELGADIDLTPDLEITRPITLDFKSYVLTGEVTVDYDTNGESVFKGTAAHSIVGNLTVNTPNGSFDNGVKVDGTVNVANVERGTWIERAEGNTITISDQDGAVIQIVGDPSAITVSTTDAGDLSINVNEGATVQSIVSNAPVAITVAAKAELQNVTIASTAGGSTLVNHGTTGTVTANAPTTVQVASGGQTGTVTANAPVDVDVASGSAVDNIDVQAGGGGTSVVNNGTTGNVTVAAGADRTTIANNGTVSSVTSEATISIEGTEPDTVSGSGQVISLATYITAVKEANANGVVQALQDLAQYSPLDPSTINAANAAAYVQAFAAPDITTVAQIRTAVDTVNADTAVGAYENAPITTLEQIAAAENLKPAADKAVAAVRDAAQKAAYKSRVTNRAAAIAQAKNTLLATTAEAAVEAYEKAPITTLAEIAAAEELEAAAQNAVTAVNDSATKAALTQRITNRAAVVAKAKEDLSAQQGPEVLSASAVIGSQTVTAQKQTDGTWLVDLSHQQDSDLFTEMTINADSDTKEASMTVTTGSGTNITRTIQFSNGVANVNIHDLLGSLDTGDDGLLIGNLKALGVTTFTATLTDTNNRQSTVVIHLSYEDVTAPDVLSANALIGGSTVDAVKDGDEWQVDLSHQPDSALFTEMNITADSDATEASMSVATSAGTTVQKTIQFTGGVSNVNIHDLLGELDTGEEGVTVGTLRSLGITTFTAELKDAANNTRTITIRLNLSDTIAPDVLSASAMIGGNTVNAVKEANGWCVNLAGQADSSYFTNMTITADSDAAEATMSVTTAGGTEVQKTIQFTDGVANVNIHDLLGELDTGEEGISVGALRSLGITDFKAELTDAAGNTQIINICLNFNAADTTAPDVKAAKAQIGENTVNAVKGTDGWYVDLSRQADSSYFTDMSIIADSDATEASMSVTTAVGTEVQKTIQFTDGVADVNIHDLLGELDTGEEGISVGTLKSLGITNFKAELTDAAGNTRTITIYLNFTESDTTAPDVLSASATIGGNAVEAVKESDGWHVDLSGQADSSYFTDMTINADSDAAEAKMSLATTTGTTITKTISFTNGVAEVNIHDLLGELDTGEEGLSVGSLRTLGLTTFTAELTDTSNNTRTVSIYLTL